MTDIASPCTCLGSVPRHASEMSSSLNAAVKSWQRVVLHHVFSNVYTSNAQLRDEERKKTLYAAYTVEAQKFIKKEGPIWGIADEVVRKSQWNK